MLEDSEIVLENWVQVLEDDGCGWVNLLSARPRSKFRSTSGQTPYGDRFKEATHPGGLLGHTGNSKSRTKLGRHGVGPYSTPCTWRMHINLASPNP